MIVESQGVEIRSVNKVILIHEVGKRTRYGYSKDGRGSGDGFGDGSGRGNGWGRGRGWGFITGSCVCDRTHEINVTVV